MDHCNSTPSSFEGAQVMVWVHFSNWIHIILLESVEMFICMNIHYDRITVMIICCCDESFLEHREEGKVCSPKGRC